MAMAEPPRDGETQSNREARVLKSVLEADIVPDNSIGKVRQRRRQSYICTCTDSGTGASVSKVVTITNFRCKWCFLLTGFHLSLE